MSQGSDRSETAESPVPPPPTIRTVGPFEIVRRLGQGGYGVVYEAQQSRPYRRVAVKTLTPDLLVRSDQERRVQRFQVEQDTLARLDHPNVAKVFATGVDESGLPYFAMELIKGKPIVEHCDEHRLSIRERLSLFVDVCRGVHHAHQQGVIHRDIKSVNVLVAEYDKKPTPKVIDFGIAKWIDMSRPASTELPESKERDEITLSAEPLGTLVYMSPEQAAKDANEVGVLSDVYGLGALLYELLTGTAPIPGKELATRSLDKCLEVVREYDRVAPSVCLQQTDESVSVARNSDSNKLMKIVSGELDAIVLQALAKDPSDRYDGANALADDVERYLNRDPVVVMPQSLQYRMSKWARKHWISTSVAAAFTTLLCASIVTITSFAITTLQQAQILEKQNEDLIAANEAERDAKQLAVAGELAGRASRHLRNGEAQAALAWSLKAVQAHNPPESSALTALVSAVQMNHSVAAIPNASFLQNQNQAAHRGTRFEYSRPAERDGLPMPNDLGYSTAWSPNSNALLLRRPPNDGPQLVVDRFGVELAELDDLTIGLRFWWSPYGDRMISESYKAVKLHSTNGDVLKEFSGLHIDADGGVLWHPDGRSLVVLPGTRQSATLWDADGREEKPLGTASYAEWSHSGEFLLTLEVPKSSDSSEVRIWTREGQRGSNFSIPKKEARQVGWVPRTSNIWHTSARGRETDFFRKVENAEDVVQIRKVDGELVTAFSEVDDGLTDVIWSPDGTVFVTVHGEKAWRLWQADGSATGAMHELDEPIKQLGWNAPGYRVAVLMEGGTSVDLWSSIGEQVHQLQHHEGDFEVRDGTFVSVVLNDEVEVIRSFQWSPTGNRIVTLGKNTTLWDDFGDQLSTIDGEMGSVTEIAWSPGGDYLACVAAHDRVVQVRSADGHPISALRGLKADPAQRLGGALPEEVKVVWSPGGDSIAVEEAWQDNRRRRHRVRLFRPFDSTAPTLPGHRNPVDFLEWAPDGKTIVTAIQERAYIPERTSNPDGNGSVVLRSKAYNKSERRLQLWYGQSLSRLSHLDAQGDVKQLGWCADGTLLAFVEQSDLHIPSIGELAADLTELERVQADSANYFVDTSRSTLRILAASGELNFEVPQVRSFDWHPSEPLVAVRHVTGEMSLVSDQGKTLASRQLNQPTKTTPWSNQPIETILWSKTGSRLLAGDTLLSWQDGALETISTYDGAEAITWNKSGSAFVMSHDVERDVAGDMAIMEGVPFVQYRSLSFYDSNGAHVGVYRPERPVSVVAWSPDDQYVVVAGSIHEETDEMEGQQPKIPRPQEVIVLDRFGTEVSRFHGHFGRIRDVAWHPDPSKHRFATCGDDKTVHLWDVQDGLAARLEGHNNHVLKVAWDPSGRVLASAAKRAGGDAESIVQLWNVDGYPVATLSEKFGSTPLPIRLQPPKVAILPAPYHLKWNDDGTRLAVCLFDSTPRVYNTDFDEIIAMAMKELHAPVARALPAVIQSAWDPREENILFTSPQITAATFEPDEGRRTSAELSAIDEALERGRADDALEQLVQLLKYDLENPDLIFRRGRAYVELGKIEKAIRDMTWAVKQEPQRTEWRLELANHYLDLGWWEEYLDVMREVMISKKDDEDLRDKYASILFGNAKRRVNQGFAPDIARRGYVDPRRLLFSEMVSIEQLTLAHREAKELLKLARTREHAKFHAQVSAAIGASALISLDLEKAEKYLAEADAILDPSSGKDEEGGSRKPGGTVRKVLALCRQIRSVVASTEELPRLPESVRHVAGFTAATVLIRSREPVRAKRLIETCLRNAESGDDAGVHRYRCAWLLHELVQHVDGCDAADDLNIDELQRTCLRELLAAIKLGVVCADVSALQIHDSQFGSSDDAAKLNAAASMVSTVAPVKVANSTDLKTLTDWLMQVARAGRKLQQDDSRKVSLVPLYECGIAWLSHRKLEDETTSKSNFVPLARFHLAKSDALAAESQSELATKELFTVLALAADAQLEPSSQLRINANCYKKLAELAVTQRQYRLSHEFVSQEIKQRERLLPRSEDSAQQDSAHKFLMDTARAFNLRGKLNYRQSSFDAGRVDFERAIELIARTGDSDKTYADWEAYAIAHVGTAAVHLQDWSDLQKCVRSLEQASSIAASATRLTSRAMTTNGVTMMPFLRHTNPDAFAISLDLEMARVGELLGEVEPAGRAIMRASKGIDDAADLGVGMFSLLDLRVLDSKARFVARHLPMSRHSVEQATKLNRMSSWSNERYLQTLALAHAASGNLTDALRWQEATLSTRVGPFGDRDDIVLNSARTLAEDAERITANGGASDGVSEFVYCLRERACELAHQLGESTDRNALLAIQSEELGDLDLKDDRTVNALQRYGICADYRAAMLARSAGDEARIQLSDVCSKAGDASRKLSLYRDALAWYRRALSGLQSVGRPEQQIRDQIDDLKTRISELKEILAPLELSL